MKQYLVVANQTLGGSHLREAIHQRLTEGPCRFHVVVPAAPAPDLYGETLSAYEGQVPDEQRLRADARQRLDVVLARLRGEGADVDGEVCGADPLQAVTEAVGAGPPEAFDEVILSTLPPGASRWLAMDLVHRVERSVSLPVTHVYGPAAG